MAVTQNTYTGNGSTVLYSFTFPYLETTDIKVSVNGTVVTTYTFANATTIQFNTAPANGAAIRIYRQTDDSALPATFYSGSAIRSADLNDNFTQNLYVTQESTNNAATATTTANTALSNSSTALSQSNTAISNSATALSQSNTAISNSATALSQSNTAISNSASAVSTANTASTNASNAVTTANTALSTANTASSNASAAVSTANTASSNASAAVSTANTASSNASTALSTANTALSTATTADTNATAALNAVAGTVQYVLVANVAAIPGTPSNGYAIEIADSTGIQSFTPLTNLPSGYVGDPGLSVRLQYLSAGSSWNWLNYFANNAETRYLKLAGGTVTGNLAVSGTLTKSGNNVVTVGDTGTVTSTMIANGTIVDADVNASAAIAGTKVSPDFGSQTITTTGVVSAAAGAAATPSITFTGDLNTGIYSPGADQVAISTAGSGRLFVDASGNVGVGTSSITTVGGYTALEINNGTNGAILDLSQADVMRARFVAVNSSATIETSGSIPFLLSPGGTEKLRVTSAGLVGIGVSSPIESLSTLGNVSIGNNNASNPFSYLSFDASQYGAAQIRPVNDGAHLVGLAFYTDSSANAAKDPTEKVRITSGGLVGIGTTAPSELLTVNGVTPAALIRTSNAAGNAQIKFNADDTNYAGIGLENTALVMRCSNSSTPTERARIDSSGRLLVGTSSALQTKYQTSSFQPGFQSAATVGTGGFFRYSADSDGPAFVLSKSRNASLGSQTVVVDGDAVGYLGFAGSDGTAFQTAATIIGQVDGTPGANDMPGRLVFSTTADGASSPTERMRITQAGNVLFGKTDTASATVGIAFQPSIGYGNFTRSGGAAFNVNRMTNDGELVVFVQDDVQEGSISVSGTTVSYNGAHLSRWSQLPSGAARTEILRGTVLSNINEMCEWTDEENEQLNRMKVSDVEGDKNVSGVFQGWDDDDDTYTNDFYCAMTGDFIIRISAGVTVERGDLLMSAGNGTAKPQDDDIIRSKTIAKVTSTNVSCTYEDGSYCVPCVLMAC